MVASVALSRVPDVSSWSVNTTRARVSGSIHSRRRFLLASELAQEPDDGVVVVGHALLHGERLRLKLVNLHRVESGGPTMLFSSDPPQDPQRRHRAEYGATVGQDRDRRPPAVQADVLQDEAEAMGPVVEGERDEHEHVELDQRIAN